MAGRGHQGREARRARRRPVAFAGRRLRAGAAADLLVLAVGVQAQGGRRQLPVRPGHPAVRPDLRDVHPVDRDRHHPVPETLYPRRDFDPGAARRRLPRDRPQDGGGEPGRRLQRVHHRAAQDGRAVAGRGPGRVRPVHPGCVCRGPDQEPVEAGGAHRQREEGRAVDVGLDPALPGRDHLPGPRHRHLHRGAVRQDAARGPRRRRHGNRVPVARVRRRRHHPGIAGEAAGDQPGCAKPGDAHQDSAHRHAPRGQAAGPGELQLRRVLRLHQGVLASGLPRIAVRGAVLPDPVPLPPVAVRRAAFRQADLRAGRAGVGATADHHRHQRVSGRQRCFVEPVGPAFWERTTT